MFLAFLFKWAIALTLLYSLYGLLLRRETFYRVNRFVLLAMLPLSAWLATLKMETPHANIANRTMAEVTDWMEAAPSAAASAPQAEFSYTLIVVVIYYAGLLIVALQYLFALFQVVRIIRKSRAVADADYCLNDAVDSPFSWFRWIVISSMDVAENGRVFLAHERAHVRHGHSWDMLLCEFCVRLQWFNPFAWQLREDLRAVHEFQADQSVIKAGCNVREYNMLLIDKALGSQLAPVANALTQGELKNRIRMMHRKPSPWMAMLKVLYIVPFALVTLAIFAKPIAVQNIVNARSVAVLAQNVQTLVNPTVGDAQPTPQTHPQPLPEGREEVTTTKEEANENIDAPAALPQPPSTVQSAPLPRREGSGGGSADIAEIKASSPYLRQRAEKAIAQYLDMIIPSPKGNVRIGFPIEITIDREGNITDARLGVKVQHPDPEWLPDIERKARTIPHELTRDYARNSDFPEGQDTQVLIIQIDNK